MEPITTRLTHSAQGRALGLWKARARDLADLCAVSAPCEEADRLLAMVDLFDEIGSRRGPPACAEGGVLDTALDMLGDGAGYLLSRGPGGPCMATVVLAGSHYEQTAEGATPALAVLGAHLLALLGAIEKDQAGLPHHMVRRASQLN